jgi:hypothetical protein
MAAGAVVSFSCLKPHPQRRYAGTRRGHRGEVAKNCNGEMMLRSIARLRSRRRWNRSGIDSQSTGEVPKDGLDMQPMCEVGVGASTSPGITVASRLIGQYARLAIGSG